MIYLDSAAVAKLCHRESATEELVGWLRERSGRPLVSSALVEVEVPRALRRHAEHALPNVPAILDRIYRVEMDHTVRATAAAYTDHGLRTLDALHLATAQLLDGTDEELTLVTYEHRLLESAAQLGFATASPGQDG